MTESSHTGSESDDVRDRLGYAVRELHIGTIESSGRFHDLLRHGKSRERQSIIWVSSTDPWHRRTDRDDDLEQLGIDAIYRTGLTHGLPMLTPVALLYGTPEDSAAQIRYMQRRGLPIAYVEMGEEPNGQIISPEDYGALYRQWTRAIHGVDRSLRLGGPAFQSSIAYVGFWPDRNGRTTWIGRFLDDLRAHGQLADYAFFSFEWYPFDDVCRPPAKQLLEAPSLLPRMLKKWRDEGLPETIPWLVTEYGWSSYAAVAEVELYGGIFNADFVAQYLEAGGAAAYFYGYEPDVLLHESRRCDAWGNLILLQSDDEHHIRNHVPAYWAAVMLTRQWAMAEGEHAMYAATIRGDNRTIAAHALRRPDGKWSVMLVNRSDRESADVQIRFADAAGAVDFPGNVTIHQYSREQYQWRAGGENGHPTRDLPPRRTAAAGSAPIHLPPLSLTVVTGTR